MDRTKETLKHAEFRTKGKWYLALEVDSFLDQLSVSLEEDARETEELEEKLRTLRQENARLEEELKEAQGKLERWKEQSAEERQRRVCQELEQERDLLIQDIKALRQFRESFRDAVAQDAERLIQQMEELVSSKLL